MIPQKLEHATKVSIGSLVVEMQSTLTSIGDPALAMELPKLSRKAYETILSLQEEDDVLSLLTFIGGDGYKGIQLAEGEELKAAIELEQVGLIQCSEPIHSIVEFANSLPHKPEPYDDEETYIPENAITKEQYSRLLGFNCKITTRGRKLYEVMIEVILSNLTTKKN